MKKITLLVAAIVAAATVADFHFNQAHTNSSGAPQGTTGATGEGTCNNCHSGPSVTNQAVSFTSNVPVEGYVPGSTYTITAALTGGLSNTFGFQASPQNAAGQLQGSMTAGAGTQLVGAGGKYITHTSAGTMGSGNAKTWTWQWTAPNPGTGTVTFYGAFNFANGVSGNQGDVIRTSTLALSQASGVGVEDMVERGFTVFPNPANGFVNITLPTTAEKATVTLVDLTGRVAISNMVTPVNGQARLELGNTRPGVYLLAIEFNGQRKVTKLLVD